MQLQDGFAEVNGTRLYYQATGSGDPLVLIHGFTLNHRMWDDQFEAFAQSYRVIRYDVRGFGKSAMPTDRNYAYADDLWALLDHLGTDHAHILGLSMGGGISIQFAEKYPDATDTLTLVGPALGIYEMSQIQSLNYAVQIAEAKESGIRAANEVLKSRYAFAPALERPEVATRLTQILDDYPGWHWVNDNPMHSLDPPAQPDLHKISARTLVIIGGREQSQMFQNCAILQRRIRNARTVIIPGAGHITNMEEPETFNEAVLDFLSGA